MTLTEATTVACNERADVCEQIRLRCYLLVSKMPNDALHELEEELREIYEHYVFLESTAQLSALPPSKAVVAVVEHVTTPESSHRK
jgi:hypothetical protein